MIKMKSITALCLAALALASCNKIDFPIKETTDLVDVSDTIFPDTNTNATRHVLVEEFTGHTCAPCPGGAKLLRTLYGTYEAAGKELVLVGIHEGSQAYPHVAPSTDFLTEFRVGTGSYLANTLFAPDNLVGTPSALINRVKYPDPSTRWIYMPDWQIACDNEFAKPNVLNLDMVVDYDTATESGTVAVRSWFLDNMSSDFYLVVYLTQDSIVDWQKNGPAGIGDDAYTLNTDLPDYVHRHVLRGTISGPPNSSGILVKSGSVVPGEKIIKAFNFNLATMKDATHENIIGVNYPAFDHHHFGFVAFVYDYATGEVLQVIEDHL